MFIILVSSVWLSSLRMVITNKRTTMEQCFYDSLVKPHASFDSHRANMPFFRMSYDCFATNVQTSCKF